MGKKGKRSKQKNARKEADELIREADKLLDEANTNEGDGLNSKGADQYREVIRRLESETVAMVYRRHELLFQCYFLLITLEYRRRNYHAAIECCNFVMAKSRHMSRHMSSQFRGLVSLFHQMIMLRLSGQECNMSDFIHYISQEGGSEPIVCMVAVCTLRCHKQFDSAIKLSVMCGPLKWSPLKSKLSLAMTYLEQYRLEFHQRSRMREKDFSTMDSLITPMMVEYPIEHNISFEYCLVVAQWYYLTHTQVGSKEDRERLIGVAQSIIEVCLEFPSPFLPYSRLGKDECYTCGQVATLTEVQFVCSGCRVACYCSIDHQRMTWKKEAVSGMCIGHEILCPLYKAYRKHTEAKKSRNKEKESRMKRRLGRECVNFLEYGLGLKDKCFPCGYQKRCIGFKSTVIEICIE